MNPIQNESRAEKLMVTDENAVSDPMEDESTDKNSEATHQANDESTAPSEPENTSGENEELNAEINKLKEQLEESQAKAEKHWEELLRAKADLDNTRKRLERDVENAHKFAVEKFVQDLLPVIDSLEMGIKAANEMDADIHKVKEGTELTLKMFSDCAGKFGIEAMDPTGQPFDPELHQAMTLQESDEHVPNTVMAVMQKGYLLNGRLVRPAMVVVSKAAPKAKAESEDENTGTEQATAPDESKDA